MTGSSLFGGDIQLDIVILCWIAFVVVWIVSAFGTKRYARRGSWGLGIRVIAVIVIAALLQSGAIREFFLQGQHALSPGIQWLGAILTICGISFAIWARMHLGRNWGMPMSLKQDPELVTSGPYRYVRHPIYSGMILTMLGTMFVDIRWIIMFVVFFVYFIWAARTEEEIMSKQFPETYPEYMMRSKILIPFVL